MKAAWTEARRAHAHALGRLFWPALLAESVSEESEVPSKSGIRRPVARAPLALVRPCYDRHRSHASMIATRAG